MTIVVTSHMSVVYQWMATVNHFPATCIILSSQSSGNSEDRIVRRIEFPDTAQARAVKLNANLTARYQSTGRRDVGTSWDEIYRTKYRSWVKSEAEIARTHQRIWYFCLSEDWFAWDLILSVADVISPCINREPMINRACSSTCRPLVI